MRVKPLHWRHSAKQDAADTASWYAEQDGLALGERFLAQLQATLEHIGHFPASGSTRHAHIVPDLPAPLRFFPVSGFDRHLVYYIDLPAHIDIIRIWNASRGLDALMDDAQDVSDPDTRPAPP